MSFGYSISDAVLLTQLAWNTVQNARRACGEYDELTQQVSALHVVLGRFQKETSVEESEGQSDSRNCEKLDSYNDELHAIVNGCEKVLGTMDKILKKYNSLSERERDGRPKMLWKKVRFGNGEMADLGELRGKVVYHTSLLTLFLNLRSTGSIGRVEQRMNDAGGHLKEIKGIVNGIAAAQISQPHQEGSILSAYTNDDKSAWKDIRRELRHKHGFHDADLRKHKAVIVDYITELGHRGVLDERDRNEDKEENEDEECDNRAAFQADVATDEPFKALRDTDDGHSGPDLNVSSDITSKDDTCDGDQILAGSGGESLLESLAALQKRFDEDYMPSCLEFLSAPPKDEESSVERHTFLSDGILTNILLKVPPIDLDSNDSSDSPKAQMNDFLNQIQRWLAKLDEAKNRNNTELLVQLSHGFYNGLVVHFINTSVRQDSYGTQRKKAYATMRKLISEGLALLDEFEVNGSPGLRIIKAHLKGDLKAMRQAISKVEKTTKWEWKDHRSKAPPTLIPRVVLEINQAQHEIVLREEASIDLVRHPYLTKKSAQDVCISCRRPSEDLRRGTYFRCNHDWCEACFCFMLELSYVDPGVMPLKCCGDCPLDLCPLDKLYGASFEQWRGHTFLDTTADSLHNCQIDTCGNPMKPGDYHWFVWLTGYRGYSLCSKCKTLHILKMRKRGIR